MTAPACRPAWRPVVTRTILGVNIGVFAVWVVSLGSPALHDLMIKNFLVSPLHLARGRVWTLLTAEFSHNQVWHLALNMIVLMSFAPPLERLLGRARFLRFYLGAAIVASVAHCALTAFYLRRSAVAALGASGALSGVLLLFALLFPRQRILLFGIVPVPALAGALLFVALDVWGLTAQRHGGGLPIGHGAHLGGALAGAGYYLLLLRRVRRA